MRTPKSNAEQSGVSEGSAFETNTEGDRVAKRKRSYDLTDLLSRITAENLHPEQETGEPQGNEHW